MGSFCVDAITDFDVDGRILFIAASANAPVNSEAQQRYGRIALRELIDDRLKAQEAKWLGIAAGDKEVGAAIPAFDFYTSGHANSFLARFQVQSALKCDGVTLNNCVRAWAQKRNAS